MDIFLDRASFTSFPVWLLLVFISLVRNLDLIFSLYKSIKCTLSIFLDQA